MIYPRQTLQRGSYSGTRPVLRYRRILVVEDDHLQAENLRQGLEELGVTVLGPMPSVATALALLAAGTLLDAAILDVGLGGEMVFPVAKVLEARSIPFVFITGYDAWTLPSAFTHVPCWEKPLDVDGCLLTLFGQPAAA